MTYYIIIKDWQTHHVIAYTLGLGLNFQYVIFNTAFIAWHCIKQHCQLLQRFVIMRAVLCLILLLTVFTYDLEGDVLVLHDSDFPAILEEFPSILIEFYAPWCGHCKHLAPVYAEAATELKNKNSAIKLAKVDSTVEKQSSSKYEVRGYPTLIFFHNGQNIPYKGARDKEGIINWCEKKLLPVLIDISSEEVLNGLSGQTATSVVLFSADSESIQTFKNLASADDNNNYYLASGELLNARPEGTVEIHRNFDAVASRHGVVGLAAWISRNSRPAVVDFDQRTITSIFSDGKSAVVLFNADSDSSLSSVLLEFAKSYEGSLLFTEIPSSNEHYHKFAEYIKLGVSSSRILIVNGGARTKFLFQSPVAGLTTEHLAEWVAAHDSGALKSYSMTDAVAEAESSDQSQVAEEL